MVGGKIIAQSRILALLVAVSSAALAQDTAHEQAEIRNLMRVTWERPNAPLSVDPVVVHHGYAIAGWVQEERGGRALLRRGNAGWEVILCAGDHLRSAETVIATGAPPAVAQPLVAKLIEAEERLPPERLAKLAMFDAVLRMDDGHPKHRH
jgi:hypothetical protein